VTQDSDQCPFDVEEIAEVYLMGTLPAADAQQFEAHYPGCSQCAAVLDDTAAFIRAMRNAASVLRSEPE
jgi:anti-sigma factor RsiW